jgi:hypothetical protein
LIEFQIEANFNSPLRKPKRKRPRVNVAGITVDFFILRFAKTPAHELMQRNDRDSLFVRSSCVKIDLQGCCKRFFRFYDAPNQFPELGSGGATSA